jgi:hypothetical protein
VSVTIWIVSKALWVLSHEFGHVLYQVPNLASYVDFHKDNYLSRIHDVNRVGHNPNDPSGKTATDFEVRFRKNYSAFIKNTDIHLESPVLLVDDIRKKIAGQIDSVAMANL